MAQDTVSACGCPLPPPYIKINVDAIIYGDSCFLGVVTRNWRGDVLKRLAKRERIVVIKAAEAKAILLALQVARNSNWECVVVESDAQYAVRCNNLC